MQISEIIRMPTTDDGGRENKVHESVFRSYHILNKVKDLLAEGTPAPVVIELIDFMQGYIVPKSEAKLILEEG